MRGVGLEDLEGAPFLPVLWAEVGLLVVQKNTSNVHPSQPDAETKSYHSRMPWGLKRFYGSGDLHFITCSCYRRRPLLGSPWRRDLFLQVLEEVRQRYSFVVVAYVAMPEHFHLLVSEPQNRDPSVVIQAVKIGFARRVINRDGNPGSETAAHIWQRRFYDFNVWGREKRVEKIRYIHRNPVRRGLVKNPEDWRWSSFRAYAFGEVGPVIVNDWSVLKMKVRAVGG